MKLPLIFERMIHRGPEMKTIGEQDATGCNRTSTIAYSSMKTFFLTVSTWLPNVLRKRKDWGK